MNKTILQRIIELDNIVFYRFEEFKSGTSENMFRDSHTIYTPDKDDIYIENLKFINNYTSLMDDYEPSNIWIMHKYFGSGDYVGSSVEKSNTIVFLDEHQDRSGIKPVYGGYGFTSVVILYSWMIDPINQDSAEEILDILEGLNNYPLISDDEHSQVETDLSNESWECCFEDDFIRALINSSLINEDDELLDIRDFFEDMAARANVYWINETGTSMYIDVDEIVKQISKDDIESHISKIKTDI